MRYLVLYRVNGRKRFKLVWRWLWQSADIRALHEEVYAHELAKSWSCCEFPDVEVQEVWSLRAFLRARTQWQAEGVWNAAAFNGEPDERRKVGAA